MDIGKRSRENEVVGTFLSFLRRGFEALFSVFESEENRQRQNKSCATPYEDRKLENSKRMPSDACCCIGLKEVSSVVVSSFPGMLSWELPFNSGVVSGLGTGGQQISVQDRLRKTVLVSCRVSFSEEGSEVDALLFGLSWFECRMGKA